MREWRWVGLRCGGNLPRQVKRNRIYRCNHGQHDFHGESTFGRARCRDRSVRSKPSARAPAAGGHRGYGREQINAVCPARDVVVAGGDREDRCARRWSRRLDWEYRHRAGRLGDRGGDLSRWPQVLGCAPAVPDWRGSVLVRSGSFRAAGDTGSGRRRRRRPLEDGQIRDWRSSGQFTARIEDRHAAREAAPSSGRIVAAEIHAQPRPSDTGAVRRGVPSDAEALRASYARDRLRVDGRRTADARWFPQAVRVLRKGEPACHEAASVGGPPKPRGARRDSP